MLQMAINMHCHFTVQGIQNCITTGDKIINCCRPIANAAYFYSRIKFYGGHYMIGKNSNLSFTSLSDIIHHYTKNEIATKEYLKYPLQPVVSFVQL